MNNNCQLSKTFKQTLQAFLKRKEQRWESHWKNKYIQQNLSFHFLTRLEEHACSKNGTFQSVKGTKKSGN